MNVRRARTILAWCLVIGSMIGWPLSALTWAKDEPQFVLGLSWLAITLTALDLLTSSQVHEEQGDS
ncbi:MAG TPA: hypothetical protein VK899_03925 [Gemmatimonadales bacterium]|nr:hypothetical protein [Gemmatimonadales bacterium]